MTIIVYWLAANAIIFAWLACGRDIEPSEIRKASKTRETVA